jgi:hypothetical protein
VTGREVTPETFGRDVLGPIVAEFCLRLWSLASLMERRDDTALLFCARGGLRMQLAYECFLDASQLSSPAHVAPLMVSRVVAIRPSLARTVDEDKSSLLPMAATTLAYEFRHATLADVATSVAGVPPAGAETGTWDHPFTAHDFTDLLRHPDGRLVADAIADQAALFTRHLRDTLDDRRHAVIVDTGLYGTTGNLLAEGLPDVHVSSALLARTFRRGPRVAPTFGLSLEADGYSPVRRRTALLRYWHFVEWLFEPELASVRSFIDEGGVVRSNLEVPGWQEQLAPAPDTAFAGIMEYLGALPAGPAARIVVDADRAWSEFHRAVVWPQRDHGHALSVGRRSHDFGKDETWGERPWSGSVAALRGSSMWRGGEIARAGTRLRLPLLAAVEGAYGFRHLQRKLAALRPGR